MQKYKIGYLHPVTLTLLGIAMVYGASIQTSLWTLSYLMLKGFLLIGKSIVSDDVVYYRQVLFLLIPVWYEWEGSEAQAFINSLSPDERRVMPFIKSLWG